MTVLLVSDLHLSPERPQIIELFTGFLGGPARGADTLYILGDLFDYWVGDEMADLDGWRTIIAAMRELATSGTGLFVVRGNRDFLLGRHFEASSGCRLLPEETVVSIAGRPVLLLHGDSLCTDDLEHQAWRRQVLGPDWQQDFLNRPLDERIGIARSLRSQSETLKKAKPMAIMDVNPDAVLDRMRAHGVDRMIHGHTHRPAVHDLQLDGHPAQRFVLGDWYDQGSVLTCSGQEWKLETLRIS